MAQIVENNDPIVMEGNFITNPMYQKASIGFKYDEPLSETDISENYDDDMFFEGAEPRELPNYQELI